MRYKVIITERLHSRYSIWEQKNLELNRKRKRLLVSPLGVKQGEARSETHLAEPPVAHLALLERAAVTHLC